MLTVIFNKEESNKRTESGWNWFYGTLYKGDKEFEFSFCEMNIDVGGQNTTSTEITWVNETPDTAEAMEKYVKLAFEKEFEVE